MSDKKYNPIPEINGGMRGRLGWFMIPKSKLQNSPRLCSKIFSQCVIVDCHYVEADDTYRYLAFSDEFDVIKGNPISPKHYDVVIQEPNDAFFVTFGG